MRSRGSHLAAAVLGAAAIATGCLAQTLNVGEVCPLLGEVAHVDSTTPSFAI